MNMLCLFLFLVGSAVAIRAPEPDISPIKQTCYVNLHIRSMKASNSATYTTICSRCENDDCSYNPPAKGKKEWIFPILGANSPKAYQSRKFSVRCQHFDEVAQTHMGAFSIPLNTWPKHASTAIYFKKKLDKTGISITLRLWWEKKCIKLEEGDAVPPHLQ